MVHNQMAVKHLIPIIPPLEAINNELIQSKDREVLAESRNARFQTNPA